MKKRRPTISAGPTEIGGIVAETVRPLPPGAEVAGYRVEEALGRGGMGVVYRAEHVHLGRTVALKLLAPELARDTGFRDRFIRESRIAAAIHHPNIVTIYDAGEADNRLYLAMRYVEGTDLARTLEEGPLAPEDAVSVVEQIAAALDAAHGRGLVHRDVKPANVLADDEGYYLADFGLTKAVGSNSGLTGAGQMVGTLHYAAPEQIEGGPVDSRADVYALGCVLYHCLAGEPPYPRDSDVQVMYAHLQVPPPLLSSRRAGIESGVDAVVARAMAKTPDERYATAGALAAAARAAVGGGARLADPPVAAGKVLIVAADRGRRALLRGMLKAAPLELTEADDAEAADVMAKRRPGLVIVDSDEPERMVAELRNSEPGNEIRILAVTAGGGGVEGSDAVLAKPFSGMQLLLEVRALLGPEAFGL